MKNKKLEKKTLFVFKKNNLTNLTKEQMRRINGGDHPTSNLSGEPGCENKTINNQTLSG
ncbi:hypothetical protein [Pedobacter sp. D749]|uniref:hypothetical protein n=1 Tax=Pedobacter sp. D749 TaxID=2856523 RepID=UPI001C56842D|nr:hypothetical protein [Pedobacter sp. D749]QXU40502.1 hypothetical protein KYH19_16015 [Pedobacter sp. D749]